MQITLMQTLRGSLRGTRVEVGKRMQRYSGRNFPVVGVCLCVWMDGGKGVHMVQGWGLRVGT